MHGHQKPRRLRYLIIIVLIGIAAYFLWPVFFKKAEAPKTPPPPKVIATEVHVSDIPLFFDYAARLAGSREVEIRARVGGILQRRTYIEGQYIKEGAILFQIDPAPYQAALAQAQATFDQANKDWKRSQDLSKDKALSAREFEQAQAIYGQSKAALDTAKINLAYTTVRAPISGYTSEEGFSEGSLVAADTSMLTRLTQLDPMYVEFAYPDTEESRLRSAVAQGQMTIPADKKLKVEIHFDNGMIYPSEGEIRFTDSIIDPTTGTVRARAVVPNNTHGMLPGQFVRVVVKGFTQRQTIAIPEQAVLQGPKGTFVYTIDAENKAQIAPVTLGIVNRHQQFITAGLKEGDRVITEGMIKVKPDNIVTIDDGKTEAAAEKPAEGDKAQKEAPKEVPPATAPLPAPNAATKTEANTPSPLGTQKAN